MGSWTGAPSLPPLFCAVNTRKARRWHERQERAGASLPPVQRPRLTIVALLSCVLAAIQSVHHPVGLGCGGEKEKRLLGRRKIAWQARVDPFSMRIREKKIRAPIPEEKKDCEIYFSLLKFLKELVWSFFRKVTIKFGRGNIAQVGSPVYPIFSLNQPQLSED